MLSTWKIVLWHFYQSCGWRKLTRLSAFSANAASDDKLRRDHKNDRLPEVFAYSNTFASLTWLNLVRPIFFATSTTIIKYSNIQQTEDYTWRQLPHFRRAPSSRLAILRMAKSFLWVDSISLIMFWRVRCKLKRLFLTYNVLECIVPHSCLPSFANLAESWNGSLAKKWFCWDISYWYVVHSCTIFLCYLDSEI